MNSILLRSMTGYGRAQEIVGHRDITVELRSVNNRYFDCSIKLPRIYTYAEDAIRSRVQESISRGKVDVFITIQSCGTDEVSVSVNRPVAQGYVDALRQLRDDYGLKDDISVSVLARFSDIFLVEKQQEDLENLTRDILLVLDQALLGFSRMREQEGSRLAEDMEARLNTIEGIVSQVEERSPKTVAEYCAKLEQRMHELLAGVQMDEARILTEAAIFADRVAVNEETVRLRSHVSQLRDMLRSGTPIGRKLDFLVQELNREANTIGSKGNDISIARSVIDMKAEIEKIREQAQNVE
ncbi:YicC/YloC family endoribonuclease [Papillibacter cinnamivorans]|uniref:TIGR00255 family protein n=1 Tax=Papillibacter cinnamivorans DSM 12816 TaxID=1122930 RepID=A0A1W1YVK8_9FIRM|nr:YicC/YloC family endoribonuclease [Papillibacter cinnamivorans]SMC40219.1 TIGR00255 family protein [Papillibacter cinnamivorans DSM 12816]